MAMEVKRMIPCNREVQVSYALKNLDKKRMGCGARNAELSATDRAARQAVKAQCSLRRHFVRQKVAILGVTKTTWAQSRQCNGQT